MQIESQISELIGKLKHTESKNSKLLLDLSEKGNADYNSESEEINRIRNSNKKTVNSVNSFYPEFSSELNDTKAMLLFEKNHLASLEQQQKAVLLKILGQDILVLHEKMQQQQRISNYSLETVKDNLHASLTELAAAIKEVSSDQTLGQVELRSKLSDGLRNASAKLHEKIEFESKVASKMLLGSLRKEDLEIKHISETLSSYEESLNKSRYKIQMDLGLQYPALSKSIESLFSGESLIGRQVKSDSSEMKHNFSSLSNQLKSNTKQTQFDRASAIGKVQNEFSKKVSLVQTHLDSMLSYQNIKEEVALHEQVHHWEDVLASLHAMLDLWNTNSSSVIRSLETKAQEQRLKNADDAKDIISALATAENVSSSQLSKYNTQVSNVFADISDEIHRLQFKQQSDRNVIEGDIDAGLKHLQSNLTYLMQEQKSSLTQSIDHSISNTNLQAQMAGRSIQDVRTALSKKIETLRSIETNVLLQEARNLTYESKALEMLKASLIEKLTRLENDEGHLQSTEEEDRSNVQKEIADIKTALNRLSVEMGTEAQIQAKLAGAQNDISRITGKESVDYSSFQQSNKRVAAEVAQMRSTLNFTAQDILARIADEEQKRFSMTSETNGSIALLRQRWDLLRSSIASISKMVGPQGPPGPQGPMGLKVIFSFE